MNKIAVYSCVTGNYENKQDDQNWEGADFYFYTDKIVEGGNWFYRKATDLFADPRRNARYHKILSHEMFPDYEYTIWIDGSISLLVPAQKLIDELEVRDILTFRHPDRKTISEEADECIKLKRDYAELIDEQVFKIVKQGFPSKECGLAETKVVVRKNNDTVKKFNKEWFYSLTTGSLRDQLSFNYAAWVSGAGVKYMTAISRGNPWFKVTKHERNTYER